MTDHATNKRIQRQRDSRKQERRQERHTDNAALRDAVRAIGAGDAADWPQDMPAAPLEGAQDARNGFGRYAGLCGKANGAVARGDGGEA